MKSLAAALSVRVVLPACLLLAMSAFPVAPVRAAAPPSLEQDFVTPPDEARPWVFWFWSDGNITREGITADLEAMRSAGIGGVLIMEVDQGVPKGPVRMMTPEWRAMFAFAASEAKRLGLGLIMNNDPGWTGSGGPWNTPENSMQKVVWTERRVTGPRVFDGELEQPETVRDFYRDIAVLAFPTPAAETRAVRDLRPVLTTNTAAGGGLAVLIDGDKTTGVLLDRPENRGEWPLARLDFPGPFEACAFEVAVSFAQRGAGRVLCELQASDDGRVFREVARAEANAAPRVFAPVRAAVFRVVLSGNDASLDGLRVDEVALSSAFRIDGHAAKSGLGLAASPEEPPAAGEGLVVSKKKILDLSPFLRGPRLRWEVPEGDWTILRLGRTSTGKTNYPAPADARGLEVDKLSADALDGHFEGFLGKLVGDAEAAGAGAETFAGFHIDSWEVGYQNWTPRFREEFRRLRGYDPLPWLPVLTGRAVGDAALSERFLWDMRRTISDLLNENYAGRMAALAHGHGRIFSLEGYRNGPFDPLSYAGRADLPVAEFWAGPDPDNLHPSVKAMASAGHIYGRTVIGAEAFTASDLQSRHRLHPYAAKAVGDAAFCAGINHFIVHRYSMQPWTDGREPGMTMGPWGWEYERTATWWGQAARPWHEYLARCQHMLRQGTFVADLCYLQDEEGIKNPPLRAEVLPAPPPGHDYDFCSAEVVLERMSVKDGRLVLPGGMSYRVLVLPRQRLMTPTLLRRIRDLVRDGATVLGEPPLRAPGLENYPACDDEVRALAAELWGDCDGARVRVRAFGKGRVIRGCEPGEVLAGPDFSYSLNGYDNGAAARVRHIHRSTPGREIYFVANLEPEAADIVASFRVDGLRPELWRPETGAMEAAPVYDCETVGGEGCVRLPLRLGPRESVFVVFARDRLAEASRLVSVAGFADARAGRPLAGGGASGDGAAPRGTAGSFTLAAWVKPGAEMDVPPEDFGGTAALHVARNDLLHPPQGAETFREPGVAGTGLAVGRNVICVLEHGAFHFPAVLVHRASITDWTHVAVVWQDGRPSLYVNGRLARTGLKSLRDARGYIPAWRDAAAGKFKGEHSVPQLFDRALGEQEILALMRSTPVRAAEAPPVEDGVAKTASAARMFAPGGLSVDGGEPVAWLAGAGRHEGRRADGRTVVFETGPLPEALRLEGPWRLHFPEGRGAPPEIVLPDLASWSGHAEPGVRYFSGTATYMADFELPAGLSGEVRRLWLDLGVVREIARVRLNGRDLGVLWKPPFRVDVTGVARAGANTLEIDVTNTWVNRLVGDELLPSDREWTRVPRRRGFALKAWPDWFLRGERSPAGRITFTTWKHYEKDAPLPPSGLLGPVVIQPVARAVSRPR
ncbi:glycosyl hydrolase [Termitidicoccus mucosus]|uniref:Glycosyl hydrolases family 2 sugar binding domain-containing protein n=1 Tax=Termitidicoccus mucosus TaxID=1184151 RepID=A0A178IKK6_9BACT|nr:hypothetical protein AW736_10680 [Opitutaceae bacterium TSB47]